MRVELQRNRNRKERDGDGHVEQIDEFCILAGETLLEGAADPQVDSRQRQRKPRECGRLPLIHRIERQEKHRCVEQRKQGQSNGGSRKPRGRFVASRQRNHRK